MKAERNAAVDRAKAAERERDDLKGRHQTAEEKALDDAKKAGATEVHGRLSERIRASEVRAALTAAGITAAVLDLAVRADEFAKLKVTDEGEVQGLDEAVKTFKGARADLFAKPQPNPKPTDAGLGPRGTAASGFDMNDAIRRAAGRA